MHFGDKLSAFWTDLDLRHRPRGERGTSWVELWVAFEALRGDCPGAPEQMGARPRLEVKPYARTLLYNFMAASKWLLGPETVRHPTLLGTATTRGRNLRHLAVATTTAAIDAKVIWPGWLWEEIQCRVLQLRGTSQYLLQRCRGGQTVTLRTRPLLMGRPAPWPERACRHAGTSQQRDVATRATAGAKMAFRAFCPWAACTGVTLTSVPGDLDAAGARKAQITCRACGARFAVARAFCARCHRPPHMCQGHDDASPDAAPHRDVDLGPMRGREP